MYKEQYACRTSFLEDTPTIHELVANLGVILLLYIFLFQPPVVNKVFFVAAEVVIFLSVLSLKDRDVLELLGQFKQELFIIGSIVIFSLTRDIFSGEIVYFDRFLAWAFQAFIFTSIILLYFRDKKVSLFSLLYWTSFIAAVISVLLLLIPAFDQWYKAVQLDSYYERYESFEVRYRAYGISENLTFTYAFVMGLFAGYSLICLKKSYWFILPFIIFLIATIFNARIGLVPVIFFFCYILFISWEYVTILKFIASVSLLSAFSYFSLMLMGINDIGSLVIFSNLDWVLGFFTDIFGFGESPAATSTLKIIFSDFVIIPDGLLPFLFGTGESLFGKEHGSDLGFILQLNYAGLFFVLMIIFLILFCSYRLVKVLGFTHWFTTFFFCMVIILNIKGFIFAATPGGRILFLLYVYFISEKYYKVNTYDR